MTRAKRILLMASMLVMSIGSAHASLWKRSASPKASPSSSAAAAAPATMSLTSIEIESSPTPRLVLHTSGSPVYTSYSPTPDLFVVDLTGASKGDALKVPSPLPQSVNSVSIDDVTEMGTHLTRVSVRLAQPASPEATADGNAVFVTLPVPTVADTAVAKETLPLVTPASSAPAVDTTQHADAAVSAPASSEPAPEPMKVAAEPAVTTEALPLTLPKAKKLEKVETSGNGSTLDVQIATDGDVTYNTFKLKSPSRVVIDLNGVNNKLTKNVINVNDPVVKRIRVAQFKGGADPVTRVVLEVDDSTGYTVAKTGDRLHITFAGATIVASSPTETPAAAPAAMPEAPAKVAESKPIVKNEPAPARSEPAPVPAKTEVAVTAKSESAPAPAKATSTHTSSPDVTAQIPTVADNATTWKMPETPAKHTTAVISAPQDQTPPATPKKSRGSKTSTPTPSQPAPTAVSEDVFDTSQQPAVGTSAAPPGSSAAIGGTMLSQQGGRTLSSGEKVYTGEPLSLNLKDADIKDVIRTFAQLTGLNIAVDPQVTGSVTVDFADVPWDQALEIILRQNSLSYVLEGNVMRVGTVARLSDEAEANRHLAEQERLNVPLQTISFKLSYARSEDVARLLRDLASPRARIIVDTRTNQLIISEIPTYLQTMRNLIESVDIPTRQVVIEARIVETTKEFIQQYGFNWGVKGRMDPSLGTGTGLVFPNRIDFLGGPFEFGPGNPVLSFSLQNVLGTFTLDLALNAAETEGLVRVISAPRVMTQDNTPAEIQSGFQLPYQTRINFTTTVAYVDATLRLSVTPQITEAGTVIMDISVQKNEPAVGLRIEGAAGTPLSTRLAKTRLMVRDGGTSVIAGIYQVKENNAQTRMPILHTIPIIGALFRTHDYNSTNDELLIFITPRIVRS